MPKTLKEIWYGNAGSDLDKKFYSEEELIEIIDKHTIKNADGEDYIACPPSTFKRELGLRCHKL